MIIFNNIFLIKINAFLYFLFIFFFKNCFIVSFKLKNIIIRKILKHFKIISYVHISFKKQISGMFLKCNCLMYIYIINSNEIPYKTFDRCKNLKIVFIGKKTKKIQSQAFNNCSNLEIIFIPKNIELIKNSAFNNCSKLTKIFFY